MGDRGRDADGDAGFLYLDSDRPWPEDYDAVLERLPETWLVDEGGVTRVDRNRRAEVPRVVRLDTAGVERSDGLAVA